MNSDTSNKLLKINGEYVKLYITTNSSLPKLLKNTGSLVVYNDSKTYSPDSINYLYLGNELISSGYGFKSVDDRNRAQKIIDQYDRVYEILTGSKGFWGNSDNNEKFLVKNYSEFYKNLISGTIEYTIPDLIQGSYDDLLKKINFIRTTHVGYKDEITKENTPTITQKLRNGKTQKINLSDIPYLFGAAHYNEPIVKNIDFEIEYGYYARDLNQIIGVHTAEKVDGKYLIPKGAFIKSVAIKLSCDLKDAGSIESISFNYANTKFNCNNIDPIPNIANNNIRLLFPNNTGSSKYSIFYSGSTDNYEWTSAGKTFEQEYGELIENKLDKIENIEDFDYSYKFDYNNSNINKYLLVTGDLTVIKNIAVNYTKTTESQYKPYAAYTNSLFDNSITNQNSPYPYISYEYALSDGKIELDAELNIKCVDVCRSYSSIKSATECIAQNTNINQIFDCMKNEGESDLSNIDSVSIIHDSKCNIVINKDFIQGSNKNILSTYIAIPAGKQISKIYVNCVDKKTNHITKSNITGLLKYISNCNVIGSCSPTITSGLYISSFETDDTNIFAQPFSLYVIFMNISCDNDKAKQVKSYEIELIENKLDNVPLFPCKKNGIIIDTFNKEIYEKNALSYNDSDNSNPYINIQNAYNNGEIIHVINNDYDGTHIYNIGDGNEFLSNISQDKNRYKRYLQFIYNDLMI